MFVVGVNWTLWISKIYSQHIPCACGWSLAFTKPCYCCVHLVCVAVMQVKFSLDFGPALGGKFTAKPVAAFLDPFIRDTLANLLVWPNR